MFLSKIELDAGRYHDPYQWHQGLWSLFPGQPAGAERSFLFWVNRLERHQRILEVLMQSHDEPIGSVEGLRIRGTKVFEPKPQHGQVLHFRLTANPVKTISDERGRVNARSRPKACRVPVINEVSLQEWVTRKLLPGAEVLTESLVVQPRPPLYFHKRGRRPGKIVPVDFEGLCKVTDSQHLLALLSAGIGPAKAFGCGLILLRRH